MRAEDRNGGMFIALSAFSLAIKELGSFIKKKKYTGQLPLENLGSFMLLLLIRKMILRCTKCCKQLKGWREKKN